MKKQMLLTCAVVAMACGTARAGEYVAASGPPLFDPSPPVGTNWEYASAGPYYATSWASDGSAATFNKSHSAPATGTATQKFVYTPFDPLTDGFPSGHITRTVKFDGTLSASKHGNASASAKVVFSLTGAADQPTELIKGSDGGTTLSIPETFLTSEDLKSPVMENNRPTITVVTTIGVVSSMTAKGTWDPPTGNPPNAMATSGYNHISITSVTCVRVAGIIAALPSSQRLAYARVR